MPVQFQAKNKTESFLTFGKIFPRKVIAFVSDRTLDFARSNIDPAVVHKRTQFFKQQLKVNTESFLTVKQVHGKTIIEVREADFPFQGMKEADGMFTREVGIPLTIRTADCLSVFIYDAEHNIVGLIHAGWRGTKEGIVSHALTKMVQEWGTEVRTLKVAMGPCIRSCCYQVGREFKDYFPQEIIPKKDGLYMDLPLANRRQLLQKGTDERNIFDCGICTCCDERFFSYRREKEQAGRMISLMMLRPNEFDVARSTM